MECKVFGKPITNSTLQEMPEYAGRTITRMDRARAALNMKNVDGKEDQAQKYLENLQASVPNLIDGTTWRLVPPHTNGELAAFNLDNVGNLVGNLQPTVPCDVHVAGSIYNATGEPIIRVIRHVWHGFAVKCVQKIENGQVATFSHTAKGHGGACAALVYRVENADECQLDWMTSWSALHIPTNKALLEIREPDEFDDTVFNDVEKKLKDGATGPMQLVRKNGILTTVGIGPGNKPQYMATITLDGL